MDNDDQSETTYRRSNNLVNQPEDKSKHLQHRLDKAILIVVVLIIITYLILFFV
ncbi:hypothetical protein [Bombilactobacillus bombi]|uniref:hypothetical protein n=1 Tax=Bombilactobacillus bombi TaxID=1303590 RepID=UPI0015F85096|nr:hypothetical protein [Bombilactobacillus bombi]